VQDLGFLAFTLPQVAILMPSTQHRGQELALEQKLANQALHARRLRLAHVHSRVQRCRIVQDRIRLGKAGVRDVVMALGCARHTCRAHLAKASFPLVRNEIVVPDCVVLMSNQATQRQNEVSDA
jgi:hypothetical protein